MVSGEESGDGKAQFKIGRGHLPPTHTTPRFWKVSIISEQLQLFDNSIAVLKKGGSFFCPLGMDEIGVEDEVEVDFGETRPPEAFPTENDPQDSLAKQTVSYLPHKML